MSELPAPFGQQPHAHLPLGGSAKLQPGLVVGPYRLQGLIGQGAMGAVFRALDPRSRRTLAIKFVLAHKVSERGLKRLQREGAALAAIDHRGILKIFDHGVYMGRPYLALELIEGARGLDEVLPTATREEAVEFVLQAARGLGAAHDRGIVHRDVKPANLLVGRDGRLVVADFGLATGDLFESADRLTQSGALAGTPKHMAPEQAMAARDRVGPATDVWALGTVLYQALTGRLPFDGDTIHELLQAIMEGRYTPPQQLEPSLSPDLVQVIETALQTDPQRRYADGAAMARALAAADTTPRSPPRGGLVALGVALVLVGSSVGVGWSLGWGSRPAVDQRSSDDSAQPLEPPAPEVSFEQLVQESEELEDAERFQVALVKLDAALELDAQSAYAWSRRGNLLRQLGRHAEARADVERALELSPQEPYAWLTLAILEFQNGDVDAADRASVRSVGLNPDLADAWSVRSVVLLERGELERAGAAAERALELPGGAETQILNNLAAIRRAQGKPEEAERILRRLTALNPTAPEPWTNLAVIVGQQGDLPRAERILDEALLHGEHAKLYLCRASLRLRRKNKEGAHKDLLVFLASEPSDVLDCTQAARALRKLGDEPNAIRALRMRLEINPDSLPAWRELGELLERADDLAGARDAYDRACALGEDAEAYVSRGELRAKTGDLTGAREDLLIGIDLEPQPDLLQRARAALAEVEARLAR